MSILPTTNDGAVPLSRTSTRRLNWAKTIPTLPSSAAMRPVISSMHVPCALLAAADELPPPPFCLPWLSLEAFRWILLISSGWSLVKYAWLNSQASRSVLRNP